MLYHYICCVSAVFFRCSQHICRRRDINPYIFATSTNSNPKLIKKVFHQKIEMENSNMQYTFIHRKSYHFNKFDKNVGYGVKPEFFLLVSNIYNDIFCNNTIFLYFMYSVALFVLKNFFRLKCTICGILCI
jgi:hypothetical protein